MADLIIYLSYSDTVLYLIMLGFVLVSLWEWGSASATLALFWRVATLMTIVVMSPVINNSAEFGWVLYAAIAAAFVDPLKPRAMRKQWPVLVMLRTGQLHVIIISATAIEYVVAFRFMAEPPASFLLYGNTFAVMSLTIYVIQLLAATAGGIHGSATRYYSRRRSADRNRRDGMGDHRRPVADL